MAARSVAAFLIKIIPFFALSLVAWQVLGGGHAYHSVAASALGWLYPLFDATGVVHGVVVDGPDVVLRLLVDHKKMTLRIVADDVTSNTAMLIALYAASPFRYRTRRFVLFFAGALVILFVSHLLMFFTFSQEAFMGYPEIVESMASSPWRTNLIQSINRFFETLGMYLIVLVLWLPYIVTCLHDGSFGTPVVTDRETP